MKEMRREGGSTPFLEGRRARMGLLSLAFVAVGAVGLMLHLAYSSKGLEEEAIGV